MLSSVSIQSTRSKKELYGDLLHAISSSDDVKRVSQLLCEGTPLEPVGEYLTDPIVLAITNNRPRILSLLLATGAPLTVTTRGLNLLQLAWYTPGVTPLVQAIITKVQYYSMFCYCLFSNAFDLIVLVSAVN